MKASLDTIRIPTPCPKTWAELAGDERTRHCDACQLNVTNLSAFTRREADEFLAARSGRTCVSYVQRSDGSIVTREEHPWARHAWVWMRPGIAALFALLPFLTACEQAPTEDPQPGTDDMRTLGRPAAMLGEMRIAGDISGTIEPGDTDSTGAGSNLVPAANPSAPTPQPPR